jgi:spermidine/putrescine-binding protein
LSFSCMLACFDQDNQKGARIPFRAHQFDGDTLHFLCWEGYCDSSFVTKFEDKYGCKVKSTYYGSGDEMLAHLKKDNNRYDVVSPSCDFASYLVATGLIEPMDTGLITHWSTLDPDLLFMVDVRQGGQVYGMPFTWGPDYLLYNADSIKETPDSWTILFAPKYKGKISISDGVVNIYLAGLLNNIGTNNSSALYNMSEEQLESCKQKLRKLYYNLGDTWSKSQELSEQFKSGKILLAHGWSITASDLLDDNINIKCIIPKEGSTGWIDRLMIVKGAKNRLLAHAWLDFISAPENMAKVADLTHYTVSNPNAYLHTTDQVKLIHEQNQQINDFNRLSWWQWVPNRQRYLEVWEQVKDAANH